MKTNSSEKLSTICTLLFALTLISASAQTTNAQWTAKTNINNTNSGDVGIDKSSDASRKFEGNGTVKIRGRGFFLNEPQGTRAGRGKQMMLRSLPPFAEVVLGTENANDYLVFKAGGTERMRVDTNGHVGIGTTSPGASSGAKLGVAGDVDIDSAAAATNARLNFYVNSTLDLIFGISGGNDSLIPGSVLGDTIFRAQTKKFLWSVDGGSTAAMVLKSTGLGIGTTSPDRKLSISSTDDAIIGMNRASSAYLSSLLLSTNGTNDWIVGTRDTSNSDFHLYSFGTSADAFTVLRASGNVGIGTPSPNDGKLHVIGASNNWTGYFLSGSTTSQALGLLVDAGTNSSDIAFQVRSRAGMNYFLVRGDGNVGIGASAGSYKLNVNGDTNVAGNLNIVANGASPGNIVAAGTIYAKYQDVAEWVESSEQLTAGTVVVLDSTKSNQVISSTTAYDTRVAGVISVQPGIALGQKGDSKVLVATTGRVKIKVDATKSPIQIGDLLVTSDVPGVAMKSEPVEFAGRKMHMPGTLIGKALEPLAKGKGEILVLLSLQ